VGALLKKQEADGKLVAALCAAPTALKKHGIGKGKKVTSYPSTQNIMEEGGEYTYLQDRVVIDGKTQNLKWKWSLKLSNSTGTLITSRGPGTALEFSLAIVEALVGKEMANSLATGMLLKQWKLYSH
jgi:protein DJ-1